MTGGVTVIGGGLAGSEAAWQIARRGVPVELVEMRPGRTTAAHRTGLLSELVCSNSLKGRAIDKAHGLLKEEMTLLGSLVLHSALRFTVPAGGALAVDRDLFAGEVTRILEGMPLVSVVRREVEAIPGEGPVIVAAGPLVSDALAADIGRFTGREHLFFYDAVAPVVEAASIDRTVAFAASRHEKGEKGDYLNCPLDAALYERFIDEMLAGAKVPLNAADRAFFFEGCLPVEEMAARGRETLRFGPMRPVGLRDPATGRRPHAVVQLRQDNLAAEHYSLVGFQTRLTYPEQARIFRMIPGLESAKFARFGQIHRNSYIDSPSLLHPTLNARRRGDLFFAGQISGVEGYTESAATGLLAGLNAARMTQGRELVVPPPETMIGALCRAISTEGQRAFQPVNATFGLLPPAPAERRRKAERRLARAERSLAALRAWLSSLGEPPHGDPGLGQPRPGGR